MTDASPRRLPGRKLVAAFLAILAVVVGTAIVFFLRASVPSGEIISLMAEGDRSALLLRRAEGTKRPHVQLVRWLDDATQPHKISLFSVQPGAVPFVVGERVLVEARTARGYPTVQAFDVRDLSFSYWAPEPSKSLEDGARGATVFATVDGHDVVVTVHPGDPGELLVFDAIDGEERVRAPLDGVAEPARITLLEGGVVRIALVDGGAATFDLRDGRRVESREPEVIVVEPRCALEGGRVVDSSRDLGPVASPPDALVDVEGGCLLRRGERFEVRTSRGVRAFSLEGGAIGPTEQEHVSGLTLFVVADEAEVAAVDLGRIALRPASSELAIRELPVEE